MGNNNIEDDDESKLDEKEIVASNENIAKENPCKPEPDINPEKYRNKPEKSFINMYLFVCVAGVSLGILLEVNNVVNRGLKFEPKMPERQKYWVYGHTPDVHNKSGFLKHVHLVLERVGYEKSTNETPWTLLWSVHSPFNLSNIQNLAPNQLVNHFPGTGYITSKVYLATNSEARYIPKAFRLPKNKDEFLKYAAENKNAMFVQKSNTHRKVFLKNVSEIDITSGQSFVQEYVQRPFLVDGYKFDIGVYVVLESVNPLRAYWYKGDVLFRYCKAKYYPFDPNYLEKYVVLGTYRPTWEVPALTHTFTELGYSMKDTFNTYIRSVGKDPTAMWEEVQKVIAETFIMKEALMTNILKKYNSSSENFFEMMRFDMIIDEDFKVHLMEANMGPNLSSKEYAPNRLLYEQLVYNLFSLTGVTRATISTVDKGDINATVNMISTQKNIAVFSDECRTICKNNCNALTVCRLCKPCLDPKLKKSLLAAHSEFIHRGDFRRLVPPPMVPNKDIKSLEEKVKDLSLNNKLLHLWYQGKCNLDITWCT